MIPPKVAASTAWCPQNSSEHCCVSARCAADASTASPAEPASTLADEASVNSHALNVMRRTSTWGGVGRKSPVEGHPLDFGTAIEKELDYRRCNWCGCMYPTKTPVFDGATVIV